MISVLTFPHHEGRSHSAGPVVEQGTHFCDLSRYFGGEVDISSVTAHSLEWYEDAGKLSGMVIDENKIEAENRIPRITSATWYVNRFRIRPPPPAQITIIANWF